MSSSIPAQWRTIPFAGVTHLVPLDDNNKPIDMEAILAPAPSRHMYFVAPAKARLRPDLLSLVEPCVAARPDVSIFYADDILVHSSGAPAEAFCKPAFDKTLLLADDYIAFPLLIRGAALQAVHPGSLTWNSACWYEFLLRAMKTGLGIDRIPHTLIASPDNRAKADRAAREAAIRSVMRESDPALDVVAGATPETSRIVRRMADPPAVTLVIPTRQGAANADAPPHIVNLLDSLKNTTWPGDKLRVLIGDDIADDSIYANRNDAFAVKRVLTAAQTGRSFNYAAKMNLLWRQAETEHIVFLNDDIAVGSRDWLEALITFTMERDVGGAGARLLFPDGTIQHAGMFGGIYGVCAHPWYRSKPDEPTYCDWARVHRECSVVTGALFATKRSALEAVNGFDEAFSLDFNDVDMCLKMRMLGYRIVYTPFAEMIHHEKGSRRENFARGDEVALFTRRWADFLADDPAYNPQLRIDTDRVAPTLEATRWVAK